MIFFLLKHLHAVLHNDDDKETVTTMEKELEQFNADASSLSSDNSTTTMTSGKINFFFRLCSHKTVKTYGANCTYDLRIIRRIMKFLIYYFVVMRPM
jgi:hypothetical protein